MIVTNVGGLPALVPHGKVGLVTEPDEQALADAILQFYKMGENAFLPNLRTEKQKYSWALLTKAILNIAAAN
jgi:glycosyltransferase involved in cell wall biosynthesis